MNENPYQSPTGIDAAERSEVRLSVPLGCSLAFVSALLGGIGNVVLAGLWLMAINNLAPAEPATSRVIPGVVYRSPVSELVSLWLISLGLPSGSLIGPAVALAILRHERTAGFVNVAAGFQILFLFLMLLVSQIQDGWVVYDTLAASFFLFECIALYLGLALLTSRPRGAAAA